MHLGDIKRKPLHTDSILTNLRRIDYDEASGMFNAVLRSGAAAGALGQNRTEGGIFIKLSSHAIDQPLYEFSSDGARQGGFAEEAAAAARLHSVSPLYFPKPLGTITIEGSAQPVGVLTEMISGSTLEHLFVTSGIRAPARLATQIIDAVSAMHGAGLAHGDLNDSNILVTPGGDIKIIDPVGLIISSAEGREEAVGVMSSSDRANANSHVRRLMALVRTKNG